LVKLENRVPAWLRLPAALLALLAAGSCANVPDTPADAALMAAAMVPSPASVTVPAVSTPATQAVAVPAAAVPAVFAKGAAGLSPKVLAMALDAVACARSRGISGRDDLLTVIDYSLPSTEPRLWVLDLARGKVLYRELVAHGRGSGDNYATRFSNVNDSRQTSLGLFLTGGTYVGGNGYSLKLRGLDEGVNDRAEARHIVMHGAWYVSPDHARSQGRLGRSWGCPALSEQMARPVIDTIKGGSFVFSYSGNDDSWIQAAVSSLESCAAGGGLANVATARTAK
jgi:hypothetical protein